MLLLLSWWKTIPPALQALTAQATFSPLLLLLLLQVLPEEKRYVMKCSAGCVMMWHGHERCWKEFEKGYEQETRDSATGHGINLVQVHLWGMEQGGAALSLCSARHKTLVESMQFHSCQVGVMDTHMSAWFAGHC
jgi:hypothetical protein